MGLTDKTSKMTLKKVSCSSGLNPKMLLMSSLVLINRASLHMLSITQFGQTAYSPIVANTGWSRTYFFLSSISWFFNVSSSILVVFQCALLFLLFDSATGIDSIISRFEGKLKREGGQLLQQGVEELSTGAVSPICSFSGNFLSCRKNL